MTEQEKRDEKFRMMTESPVERLVCRMAAPTIITMLISALYNMADTYFVGSIGTSATAAVGIVFSLMSLIQAVGFFFGHGTGNRISRLLGAQNMEEASSMAATGFVSVLAAGAVITVVGLLFLEPLALLLGATETILPYACSYLRFILLGAPFMASSLMLNNLLRFQGSAVYGMVGMTCGAFLNIALDPLLIFGLHMGVGGAALATMISQTVSFIVLLAGVTRSGGVRIQLSKFSPRAAHYKEIVRGGTPSLCRQGLASISVIFLNQLAGGYGDPAIAAMSIVTRVTMFASSALIGFGQGFQPVCGFNYGARRYDRVRRAFWFCVRYSFLVLLAIAAVIFIFAPQVIALFRRDDEEVIRMGALALRLQCVTFPLLGWVVMSNMMLQTIGMAVRASILAMARQGLFLLPALFLLTPWLGMLGIQTSQPVADLAAFALSVPLCLGVLREMKEMGGEDGAAT